MASSQNKLTIEELNRHAKDGVDVDQELFAEQRSNLLLVQGTHFNKKGSRYWNRIRDSKDLTTEQKLRITKNHIGKICKAYVNQILQAAPGVAIKPKSDSEVQDQKAAELHTSVWQDMIDRLGIKNRFRELCEDYIRTGEALVKVYWNPNKGRMLGYQQRVDEQGMPVFDEFGQPVAGEEAQFAGDIEFERLYAFNTLRDPSARSFSDSPYVIYQKMVGIEEAKALAGNDPAKLKFVEPSQDRTFKVFENAQIKDSKDQVLVREHYFRPSPAYPEGYFFICTEQGVLEEGVLPFGIFPIVYVGFDEIATSPRAHSIIKQLRPCQIEINRASSQVATHQVTLGDDKLLIQKGTTISNGGTIPGVRGIQYTGMPPTVLPGRTGDQYLSMIDAAIKEMYAIADVQELLEEEQSSQIDPISALYRSMRQKKKFSIYADKFESFLIEVCKTALAVAKQYYDQNHLIPVVGRKEFVNIGEFKSSDDLCYQIEVEATSLDAESKLGRQISMTHILQYVGNQLGKEEIGRVIRQMPYVNSEETFSDFTTDFDNVRNDILALERGEYPPTNPEDNHPYHLKRLTHRKKQADFRFLPQQIQAAFDKKLEEHRQYQAQIEAKIAAMKNEVIPTSGYLVACDFYINDPKDPLKTPKRVRLPSDAISWLLKTMEAQGNAMEQVEMMQPSAQAQLAQTYGNQTSHGGTPATAHAPMPQQQDQLSALDPQAQSKGFLDRLRATLSREQGAM